MTNPYSKAPDGPCQSIDGDLVCGLQNGHRQKCEFVKRAQSELELDLEGAAEARPWETTRSSNPSPGEKAELGVDAENASLEEAARLGVDAENASLRADGIVPYPPFDQLPPHSKRAAVAFAQAVLAYEHKRFSTPLACLECRKPIDVSVLKFEKESDGSSFCNTTCSCGRDLTIVADGVYDYYVLH